MDKATGKSLSYYFMGDDTEGFLKITVGKIDADGEWKFYSEQTALPGNTEECPTEKLAAVFFARFISVKSQLFYADKLAANSNDPGHPTLDA